MPPHRASLLPIGRDWRPNGVARVSSPSALGGGNGARIILSGPVARTAVNQEAVLDLFRKSGALLDGHFRLSSGLHSDRYLQSALVLQYPEFAEALGSALGELTRHLDATVVLSPALGGVVIGQEVGRALGVRAIFAERQEGRLTLRRGFNLSSADRVLVVEDVVTTGGSTRETADVAEATGAYVVGVGAIVDRGNDPARISLPMQSLVHMDVPAYSPDACPLCAKGLPIVKPGSRT
jgi:orotate phosphoribosyltransferase